jgi:hypothetical protein
VAAHEQVGPGPVKLTPMPMFNSLKPKRIFITFDNVVRTSKRTQHFTITKKNWLMLFKEVTAV